MSIRDEVKEQQEKMKDQDFKTKWNYFWDYYKFHVIAVVFAVFSIVSAVKNMIMTNPTYLSAILINATPSSFEDTMDVNFMEFAEVDPKKNSCIIDTNAVINRENIDEMTVATSQKVMANISAGDLDVLSADYTNFFQYAGQDVFLDLSTVYSPEELAAMDDSLLYLDRGYIDYIASDEYQEYLKSGEYDENNKYAVICVEAEKTGTYNNLPKDEMKNPVPVGIIIDDSKTYAETGLYSGKSSVIGIITNSKRIDAAKKFIDYVRTE